MTFNLINGGIIQILKEELIVDILKVNYSIGLIKIFQWQSLVYSHCFLSNYALALAQIPAKLA
jgi:hypothetical protein